MLQNFSSHWVASHAKPEPSQKDINTARQHACYILLPSIKKKRLSAHHSLQAVPDSRLDSSRELRHLWDGYAGHQLLQGEMATLFDNGPGLVPNLLHGRQTIMLKVDVQTLGVEKLPQFVGDCCSRSHGVAGHSSAARCNGGLKQYCQESTSASCHLSIKTVTRTLPSIPTSANLTNSRQVAQSPTTSHPIRQFFCPVIVH